MAPTEKVSCPVCGLFFTKHGLKIHVTRRHAQQPVEASVSVTDPIPHDNEDDGDLGDLLACMKASIPTLRRVPKGARLAVANALSSTIEETVKKNDVPAWRRLFSFPFAILEVPQKSDNVQNLTKWVKEKAEKWSSSLPFSLAPFDRIKPFHQKTNTKDTSYAKKIEAKLADGDIRGAVRLASSEETIAPMTPDTLQDLRSKHPAHDSEPVFPSPPSSLPHANTTEKDVKLAINSFYPGSAGGLDALRPQILKDLINPTLGQAADRLVASIHQLVRLMFSGNVPPSISQLLYGASITALRKADGGIRPIAVGMTWRRLASKIVVAAISTTVAQVVSPHQLGVGVKGGSEAGAHAARRYFNHHHASPKVFLKLDFRNAFNELRRDAILNAVLEHIPSFFTYISSCYASPSSLFFGQDIILSQRGVQQGDPLGPALFALTIQPIVEAISTELNIWYLDDGTIADDVDVVIENLSVVRDMGANLGLHLNDSKCEAHILNASPDDELSVITKLHLIAPSLRIAEEPDAILLGAPLSDQAMEKVIAKKTSTLAYMAKRLLLISSHAAFFILRASVSFPRLIYFLRCAPSWHCPEFLNDYDSTLKEIVESILNCALQEDSWKQSALPVKNGGLGIKHASDLSIPCFLASAFSVIHLVEQISPPTLQDDPAIQDGISLWNMDRNFDLPENQDRGNQVSWEKPHVQYILQQLQDSAQSKEDRARLLAIQQPDAGSWLFAVPSPQLGTLLGDNTFRVCCALRLGCEVCQPHVCSCGDLVCNRGYHGLRCKFSAGRRSRHEQANEVLSRALRTADIPNIREPMGCSRSDGKKPDGVTLVPWSRGKSVVWDFTCADTLAPSYINDTERKPGSAAEKAEGRKKAKYNYLLPNYTFVPIAIETFGVWGVQGKLFITELASRLSNLSGDKRTPGYLKQRMSLAIQQGNAASILGTLPPGKSMEEIFFL